MLRAVLGADDPSPLAPGEMLDISPTALEDASELLTRLVVSSTVLQSKAFALDLVATCEVRNAAKRVVNLAGEVVDSFEAIRQKIHLPGSTADSYMEVVLRAFEIEGAEDDEADRVFVEYEAAVRSELGIDPPFDPPASWEVPKNPLNQDLEAC